MILEFQQVKKYFNDRFGISIIPDGVYAVPKTTSKGHAFMRAEIKNGDLYGKNNFILFLDEELTKSWYDI